MLKIVTYLHKIVVFGMLISVQKLHSREGKESPLMNQQLLLIDCHQYIQLSCRKSSLDSSRIKTINPVYHQREP